MKYFATKLSDNIEITPEGFLLCRDVSIARSGWQDYGPGETPIDPVNGIVKIYRSPEEVFSKKTIASFEGKPFVNGHKKITPANFKKETGGHIQNVRQGAGDQKEDLVCDILIMDLDTIELVKAGKRGLSCGYAADYTETGDGEGEQTNIIGNHLALVEEGRAGPEYEINDHNGVPLMKKLKDVVESMRKLLTTFDEAVKPKEEEKPAKTDDAAEKSYDELVKMCDALSEKVKGMGSKSEDAEPKEEEQSTGDDPLQEVLKKLEALEARLSKLEGASTGDAEEEEETGDEEESENEDGDFEVTGDERARVEILAPGLNLTKDFKAQALKKAYQTGDGKKAIDLVSGGAPKFDGNVDILFNAAAEVLKTERTDKLAGTKRRTVKDGFNSQIFNEGAMTAEKVNEMNAKHYGK